MSEPQRSVPAHGAGRGRDQRRPGFVACGGAPAMLALARAWHARCLADPEAAHPFTHGRIHPQHAERLAAYWGESLGGPPAYTSALGTEADVVRAHSGNGPHDALDAAAAACFALALDDAGIPEDPALRGTLSRWFVWSNELVNHGWPTPADVPDDLRLPRWGWEGPVS
jgi:hemoglobin